eukprot:TRINITY_DN14951_c0_g1_i5.p1 TRINITY_DN14951_c0_g1~~TRINITY_DN14951_c0_g1_i5.p1  ORF type:complete len:301 (+),score=76.80 TRINITY_DN14951_c0_g1_i5:974-1876(+)
MEVPNETHVDWIVRCIGGHMEDLDHVKTALIRGESWTTALQRLIAESVNFVESHLEGIIRQAGSAKGEEKIYFWEKYIRFWKMMETLRDTPYVSRREMIHSIFREYNSEIDSYVLADIVCYLTRGTRADLRDDELEIEDLEKEEIENENPGTSQEKLKKEHKTESFMLLSEGLGGWIVSCSSRNRVAFDSLLKHPRVKKMKMVVENELKLQECTKMRSNLLTEQGNAKNEYKHTVDSLMELVKDASVWQELLGEEGYALRKKRLIAKESEKRNQLDNLELQLIKLTTDLERLQIEIHHGL